MRFSVLAGGAFETQSIDGSVIVPEMFADVHVKPTNYIMLRGSYLQQFQLGWQYQEIKNTSSLEFGGSVYLKKHTIDKTKTFTAGNVMWNYDFLFPVKILWNLGVSGSYRSGTGVFNSGTDPNTSVRFRNKESNEIVFLERAAIPYSFGEVSAGFVVSTASNMKMNAFLPNSQASRARRMKTFTEFRLEAIFASQYRFDETISRKNTSQSVNYINYDVIIDKTDNWGLKLQGVFRRKLIGFKLETGIRPGIHYRFSLSERATIIDRSYLLFGMGIGWM